MKNKIIIPLILSFFMLLAVTESAGITKIFLNPSTTKNSVGSTLTVDINVENVANFYGWDFTLYYDTRILDVKNVTEGSFMKNLGSTLFNVDTKDNYNSTHGRIWIYSALFAPSTPASGSGTLARIEFNSVRTGKTSIVFSDTEMADVNANKIDHELISGSYEFVSIPKPRFV